MGKINYTNKDKTLINGIVNKWRDIDANEVKNTVNSNFELLTGFTASTDSSIDYISGVTSTKLDINVFTGFSATTNSRLDNIEGAVINGDNGLSKDGDNIVFGGDLIRETILNLHEFDLVINMASDTGSTNGLKYDDDYSVNFTARSIPDAGWVTGITSQIRIQTVTSSTTVTALIVNDAIHITLQSGALTLANPSGGTPIPDQAIYYRIRDNGVAQSITWGDSFRPIGVSLPIITIPNKLMYIPCIWNNEDGKWDVINIVNEL